MNLHFATDDKFLDYFIENACNYSASENIYIVFSDAELIYTKNKNILHLSSTQIDIEKALKIAETCENIYLHSLPLLFAKIILDYELYKSHKLIWLFFGYEIFDLKCYRLKFLLPKTKNHLIKTNEEYFKFNLNPIQLRRNIINSKYYSKIKSEQDRVIITAISKIHYFAHYIREDFEKFVKPLAPNIEFIDWNYIGLNQMNLSVIDKKQENGFILLGNSASVFNNHLDAIAHLKKTLPKDNQPNILVPMSYSGSSDYVDKIKQIGVKTFGKSFQVLDYFLPSADYFKLMSSCKGACYYNKRSQAAGNIVWFIYNKIPVYMHPESSLFKLFKEKNINVFEICEISKVEEISVESTKKQIQCNNLEQLFGVKIMSDKYKRVLSI